MFSWNGVSLFNMEENALQSQHTLITTKNENLAMENNEIMDVQEEIKGQADMRVKDDSPKDIQGKQEAEPPINLTKRVEDYRESAADKLKEELPTTNQPVEEKSELIKTMKTSAPPFLVTLEILNHNVHNCLVDSGSSTNVMPLIVCKKLNGQIKPTLWDVTQLDRTSVKVVGEMKNVMIQLSANKKICYFIDIIIADIPDGYGMILNRDWTARLKGYFASDWSHLWLPQKGSPNLIKILREPFMKNNVTELGEGNEPADFVLGNYLTELKLEHHSSKRANHVMDTQSELLQLPQAERNDCRIIDMGSISITAQLDHG